MTDLISLPAPGGGGYGLKQVMRGELTKVASLRSTFWTLLVTVVGTLGVTILAVHGATHRSPTWYQGFDPTNQSLTGLALATLAIGVLGALAATGEYGTGTIRSSLAAAPRRGLFLAGKVAVVGVIALLVGELLTFSSFTVGQGILSAGGAPSASLGQPGVLRAVVLSGAAIALLGLLGLGLGVIVRHTAGAIGSYVGVTFLLPLLIQPLPGNPTRFTPVGILANSVSTVVHQSDQASPWLGLALLVLYSAVVLSIGAALIIRRDA
jgi:ABC-2 type transport system permease protein